MMGNALCFNATLAIHFASFIGTSRNNGFKYISIIPKILKNRWLKAATIAVGLSVRDANNAVTVVPMFAPNVKGYICLSVSTPAPAKGIIVEVVMDEL
jgi:hypothetical protein